MRSLLGSSSPSSSSSSSASSPSSLEGLGWRGGAGKDGDTASVVVNGKKRTTTSQVHLNVYDLTPMNSYFYWFGFGIFHSGIEVHGMEYGFGAHDHSTSGVFEVEPRSCPGFTYRRSVWLGTTDMSPSEFRRFLEHLSKKYHGDTYHLIAKNCNHFTDDVCVHLTGKPIPSWVNRLARVGSFCNCLLPESIQVRAVTHLPDHPAISDASESVASTSGESDDEDLDHQLLTIPSSDSVITRARPVGISRE